MMESMRVGQALIVVLLVLGVALTVGLAIVARSVTEVNVSTVQDESARALSAAEAGIEQSLGGVITGSGTGSVGTVGDVFTVQSNSSAGITSYVYPEELVAGDAATMALDTTFNDPGTRTLKVCWGGGGAVELMGYYRSGGVVSVNTRAYDSTSRGNGFDLGSSDTSNCPTAGSPFNNSALLDTTSLISGGTNEPLFLRVRMLYNGSTSQPVGFFASGWGFPAQGDVITSVGQAGGTTQKISVFKGTPDWLPMWDDAVFSGGSLTQ